jgi:hypothetical protein
MAPATVRAALEALWLAAIELAEAGNDRLVSGHRRRSARQSRDIGDIASDLSGLMQAAAILARYARARQ